MSTGQTAALLAGSRRPTVRYSLSTVVCKHCGTPHGGFSCPKCCCAITRTLTSPEVWIRCGNDFFCVLVDFETDKLSDVLKKAEERLGRCTFVDYADLDKTLKQLRIPDGKILRVNKLHP